MFGGSCGLSLVLGVSKFQEGLQTSEGNLSLESGNDVVLLAFGFEVNVL